MKIWSNSFADGHLIPGRYAFCVPDPTQHVRLSDNVNPHLAWEGAPEGTKSFAVLCVDPKVPSVGDDVNQEGRTVSASLPRVEFGHWVLVDIPAGTTAIAEGSHSEGVVLRGKSGPEAPGGLRHGINDYTAWFAGDAEMGGDYFGYDGPCPPWNDELMHEYVFTVYALDIATLPVDGKFRFDDVRNAIAGHILAEASITGKYTLNASLQG